LAFDKTNYNGLVFEGAAREGLQQPSLALGAYRKAVEVDPSAGLAWQVSNTSHYSLNPLGDGVRSHVGKL